MNGGVRKRGASWSYYFDLGKVDGKRKKKEKSGFKTTGVLKSTTLLTPQKPLWLLVFLCQYFEFST